MISINELGIDGFLDMVADQLARLPNGKINDWLDVLEDKVAKSTNARRPVSHLDLNRLPGPEIKSEFQRRRPPCPDCGAHYE